MVGLALEFDSVKGSAGLRDDAAAASEFRGLAREYRVVVKLRETLAIWGVCRDY